MDSGRSSRMMLRRMELSQRPFSRQIIKIAIPSLGMTSPNGERIYGKYQLSYRQIKFLKR